MWPFGSLFGGLFDEATKYRVKMSLDVQVEKKSKDEPGPSQQEEEKPRHGGGPSIPIEGGNAFKAAFPLASALIGLVGIALILRWVCKSRRRPPSSPPPINHVHHHYYHGADQPLDGVKPRDDHQGQPPGGKNLRVGDKQGRVDDGKKGDNGQKLSPGEKKRHGTS